MQHIGPRENIVKIKNIINTYLEIIVYDEFVYEYLCDPGKSRKKDWTDIFHIYLQQSNL